LGRAEEEEKTYDENEAFCRLESARHAGLAMILVCLPMPRLLGGS
jgi:hypothetical protein